MNKTYILEDGFTGEEREVTFEGLENFEWDNEVSCYLFSCLVADVETGETGKAYGGISASDYDRNVLIQDILSDPEEYDVTVEFD